MTLRLQITVPAGRPFAFEHGGPVLRIGRDPEGELALEGEASQAVSWNHARIELTAQGAYLDDLKSTNGTLLNGKPVSTRLPLRLGDEIQLGHTGPSLKVVELDLTELPPQPPPPRRLDRAAPPPIPEAAAARAGEKAGRVAAAAKEPAAAPGMTRAMLIDLRRSQRNTLLGIGATGVVLFALFLVVWVKSSRPAQETAQPPPESPPGQQEHPPPQAPPVSQPAPAPAAGSDGPAPGSRKAPATEPPRGERPAPREQPALEGTRPQRREIGRYVALDKEPPSILLQRQGEPALWGRLRPNDRVFTANYLLSLPGYRSRVYLKSGIHLTLWGNIPEFSNFPPVLESTVMLHAQESGTDLDLTLDRGRVHLANYKPAGEARVRVRFYQEVWDLTLSDSGSEAVLELLSHYPPGVPFSKEPGGKGPAAWLGLFVKGRARVKTRSREVELPDRAQFTWSNTNPAPAGPEVLAQLPPWWTDKIVVDPQKDPHKADMMLALKDYHDILGRTDAVIDAVLTQVWESPDVDVSNRVLGVLFLAALDALPHLVHALDDRQHAEVRGTAAYALRHWTSRNADYDLELYRTLQEKKGYSQEKAEIIMRLLHSFSERERGDPKTYQMLIAYLNHENLVIRDLALWHLSLLVPEGPKRIRYDPAADPEKRKEALEQWKKLIPDGTLPAQPSPPPG